MALEEILSKLKERDIMAAVITLDGALVSANFQLSEGLEAHTTSVFNVGDALLREAGEEATDVVVTVDNGNIVLRRNGDNLLVAMIKTKEQYEYYKQAITEMGL